MHRLSTARTGRYANGAQDTSLFVDASPAVAASLVRLLGVLQNASLPPLVDRLTLRTIENDEPTGLSATFDLFDRFVAPCLDRLTHLRELTVDAPYPGLGYTMVAAIESCSRRVSGLKKLSIRRMRMDVWLRSERSISRLWWRCPNLEALEMELIARPIAEETLLRSTFVDALLGSNQKLRVLDLTSFNVSLPASVLHTVPPPPLHSLHLDLSQTTFADLHRILSWVSTTICRCTLSMLISSDDMMSPPLSLPSLQSVHLQPT